MATAVASSAAAMAAGLEAAAMAAGLEAAAMAAGLGAAAAAWATPPATRSTSRSRGSEAMHILDLDAARLLGCCTGFTGEAAEVLGQLTPSAALYGVPCRTVLDAGLRAEALKRLGYSLESVVAQLGASGANLLKLGHGV